MRKGQVFTILIGGVLVLILSFGITLWLTEPEVPPADKIKILAASSVSDEATLNAAAGAAGLQNSAYIRGYVEVLSRVDATHVNIIGWATETITFVSKGAPVVVMAFSGGKNVLVVETKGERPDVTSALSLSDQAAMNVAFAGQLECNPRDKMLIVVATLSGAYALIQTAICP